MSSRVNSFYGNCVVSNLIFSSRKFPVTSGNCVVSSLRLMIAVFSAFLSVISGPQVGYVGKWKIDDLTKFWPRQDIDDKGLQVISLKD